MASGLGSFEFFNFYSRYRWTKDDFENFEQTLAFMVKTLAQSAPECVHRGLDFVSGTGFSLTVSAGLAVDVNGFPLYKGANTSGISAGAPTVGQGRWSLVVIRKASTDINSITEPTNPSNTVFLNTREDASIVVLDGTLGASAYPAKAAGDVVLFGLKLPAGATDALAAHVDYTVSELVGRESEIPQVYKRYDAVVGTSRYCTHEDLNAVMADAGIASIKEVLVVESLAIDTVQTINQPDKRITFKPGVTYSKGTAASGLVVSAARVDIERGRFTGFGGGSDVALGFQSGADACSVFGTRFASNTNDVLDLTTDGVAQVMVIPE